MSATASGIPGDEGHEVCAWCSSPAVEQIHVGTSITASGSVRRYSWLCDQCLRESEREREAVRRG